MEKSTEVSKIGLAIVELKITTYGIIATTAEKSVLFLEMFNMPKPSTFSVHIRKSGSSGCVHIPKEIMDAGWKLGQKVNVTIEESV